MPPWRAAVGALSAPPSLRSPDPIDLRPPEPAASRLNAGSSPGSGPSAGSCLGAFHADGKNVLRSSPPGVVGRADGTGADVSGDCAIGAPPPGTGSAESFLPMRFAAMSAKTALLCSESSRDLWANCHARTTAHLPTWQPHRPRSSCGPSRKWCRRIATDETSTNPSTA